MDLRFSSGSARRMSGPDLFDRILGSLHQAVLDDSLWPATSGLIDEVCGSKGNALVFGDGSSRDDVEIFLARFCYRGERREDLEREYFEDFHAIDERIPRVRRLPESRIVPVGALYTEEEKKTSPAYNDALFRGEFRDGINVRLDGPDGSRIVWGFADPVDGDGWSRTRVEAVECLLPHLRQFVRVRQALVDARALRSTVSGLLENNRFGVIQLDPRGRIVVANDFARAILREGDGLANQGGHLHAAFPEDDDALQAVLAGALPCFGGRGESGSMTLRRGAVAPRLVLHANPVSDPDTGSRSARIAALVLVVDPAMRSRIDPALVGALFGLTPAESQIAVLLAQNRTIHDIAHTTGRGEGTVRWHVKQAFGKLGISRQVELVQLVLSLADIPRPRR